MLTVVMGHAGCPNPIDRHKHRSAGNPGDAVTAEKRHCGSHKALVRGNYIDGGYPGCGCTLAGSDFENPH
ncbi:hypothetical protein KDU71_20125 [Carboxylicivirga sediminis]|uniref:Uncharacterized protein n=1 Tax=Carboxylicivirga sediminis TaxID=2006564 RepID=A0A941FBD9_9BACT|nr:hypothetical protein [Carboxylicivirga sediminis]MBR8537890.1 hypothetical protein [Carboxylicivirga sediminis]